jgi:DNA recombination protein RmuC
VWRLLGAIKYEFGKFGDLLEKTKKKLQESSNVMDLAVRKTRTIERKLRDVEVLPGSAALFLETEEEEQELIAAPGSDSISALFD